MQKMVAQQQGTHPTNIREVGEGDHCYVKLCRSTGTTIIYRFATLDEAQSAMEESMRADSLLASIAKGETKRN